MNTTAVCNGEFTTSSDKTSGELKIKILPTKTLLSAFLALSGIGDRWMEDL